MIQNVIRKNVSGDFVPFTFDVKAMSFFVKNFSQGEILVSFSDEAQEENCFKIPSMIAEEIFYNQNGGYYTDTVYVSGSGEVEIEALSF